MTDIFISYAHQSREAAVALEQALNKRFIVWRDDRLGAGENFQDTINDNLSNARGVAVLFCQHSLRSGWVRGEALRAFDLGKLIPVLLDDMVAQDLLVPFNILNAISFRPQNADPGAVVEKFQQGLDVLSTTPRWRSPEGRAGLSGNWLGASFLEKPEAIRRSIDLFQAPQFFLDPMKRTIDYCDIKEQIDPWLAWFADTTNTTIGHLLCGEAGSGKTRLVVELFDRLDARGWFTGFLPPRAWTNEIQRNSIIDLLESGPNSFPVAIAIDNANLRKIDELKLWIDAAWRRHNRNRNSPLKIILTSRSAGDWWQELILESPQAIDLFKPTHAPRSQADGRQTLTNISHIDCLTSGEQVNLLAQFTNSIGRASGHPPLASHWPQEYVSAILKVEPAPTPLSTLLLAMTKFSRIDQDIKAPGSISTTEKNSEPFGYAPPENANRWHPASILRTSHAMMLGQWRIDLNLQGSNHSEDDMKAFNSALSKIALVNGVATQDDLLALLRLNDGGGKPREWGAIDFAKWLHGEFGAPECYVGPMRPEIIAEHHVSRTVRENEVAECLANVDVGSDEWRSVFVLLNRATRDIHNQSGTSNRAQEVLKSTVTSQVNENGDLKAIEELLMTALAEAEGELRQILSRELVSLQHAHGQRPIDGNSRTETIVDNNDGAMRITQKLRRRVSIMPDISGSDVSNLSGFGAITLEAADFAASAKPSAYRRSIAQFAIRTLRRAFMGRHHDEGFGALKVASQLLRRFSNDPESSSEAADWLKQLIVELSDTNVQSVRLK